MKMENWEYKKQKVKDFTNYMNKYYGIKIYNERLHILLFADDIILFASNLSSIKKQFKIIEEKCKGIGLVCNMSKTRIMSNREFDFCEIESCQFYKYLGQEVCFDRTRNNIEISRRIKAAWLAKKKYNEMLKNAKEEDKIKIYKMGIKPSLLFGCQSWTMTKSLEEKINVTERKILRSIYKLKAQDDKDKTKLEKIMEKLGCASSWAKIMKLKFLGHEWRRKNPLWLKNVLEWRPWEFKRPVGRPPTRYTEELKLIPNWRTVIKDRDKWRDLTSRVLTINCPR
uniref:Reverse transcriptase domain-containing protein n=1 Tax=Parastrongyloides trichosuri TaxID=131310 RepID=A0A0N4ZL12_PARTI